MAIKETDAYQDHRKGHYNINLNRTNVHKKKYDAIYSAIA